MRYKAVNVRIKLKLSNGDKNQDVVDHCYKDVSMVFDSIQKLITYISSTYLNVDNAKPHINKDNKVVLSDIDNKHFLDFDYMDKDEADIMINKNYTANLEITFDVIKFEKLSYDDLFLGCIKQ